jgi:hypothetical protein
MADSKVMIMMTLARIVEGWGLIDRSALSRANLESNEVVPSPFAGQQACCAVRQPPVQSWQK